MEDREIASVYRTVIDRNAKLVHTSIVCGGIVSSVSLVACTALFVAGLWWQPITVMLCGALCTNLVMKGWQAKVSNRNTKEEEK